MKGLENIGDKETGRDGGCGDEGLENTGDKGTSMGWGDEGWKDWRT